MEDSDISPGKIDSKVVFLQMKVIIASSFLIAIIIGFLYQMGMERFWTVFVILDSDWYATTTNLYMVSSSFPGHCLVDIVELSNKLNNTCVDIFKQKTLVNFDISWGFRNKLEVTLLGRMNHKSGVFSTEILLTLLCLARNSPRINGPSGYLAKLSFSSFFQQP
ncbi:hypothetical protein V8G54_009953 [Vigna mungo]|uniref:Uncharacterized protein n=1 Tax=Vigna mungo TaxID=3915 RepID=A0AAQ3NXN4_VIGMU